MDALWAHAVKEAGRSEGFLAFALVLLCLWYRPGATDARPATLARVARAAGVALSDQALVSRAELRVAVRVKLQPQPPQPSYPGLRCVTLHYCNTAGSMGGSRGSLEGRAWRSSVGHAQQVAAALPGCKRGGHRDHSAVLQLLQGVPVHGAGSAGLLWGFRLSS